MYVQNIVMIPDPCLQTELLSLGAAFQRLMEGGPLHGQLEAPAARRLEQVDASISTHTVSAGQAPIGENTGQNFGLL